MQCVTGPMESGESLPLERVRQGSISARKLKMPLKVSQALAESLELRVVLQASIESAVKVLDLDMGVIYLLEDDDLYLHAATPRLPVGPPYEHRHAVLPDHRHLERRLRESRPVVVEDVVNEEMSERERLARCGQRQVVQADRAQEHRAGCRLRRGPTWLAQGS